jgi:hypothetical protein
MASGSVLVSLMGSDCIIPFLRRVERPGPPAPDHFRPEERLAWDAIVRSLAPLHLTEVDVWFLELAAMTLASFRNYAHILDDITRAQHESVFRDVLEAALVPASAMAGLPRRTS